MSPEAYEQYVVRAQQARRERAAAARASRWRHARPRRAAWARETVGFRLVELGLRLALAPTRTPGRAR